MNILVVKNLVLILCFLLINGFLIMIETALDSSRRSKLNGLYKDGNNSAKKALLLLDDEERVALSLKMFRISGAVAIMILFVYAIFLDASRVENAIVETIGYLKISFTIPILILILLIACPIIIIFGFIVPERIAKSKPESILTRTASIISIISALFCIPYKVIIAISEYLLSLIGIKGSETRATEEDVKAVIREGFEDGEIEKTEQDLVERVFSLDDRMISSVLTHKNDIVWLDISSTPEEVRKIISENPYTVYPVADERLDNIKGVVTLKDLIDNIGYEIPLKNYVKPANFLPENVNILETLQNFKDTRFEYALVTDEFGGIQGIVTLGDLLYALVGDDPIISTETGYEFIKQKEDSWIVDGQYPFYDLLRQLGIEHYYNDNPYNTLSGLILDKFDNIPKKGNKFMWKGFEISVLEMDKNRIDKVMIKKKKKPNESQTEQS